MMNKSSLLLRTLAQPCRIPKNSSILSQSAQSFHAWKSQQINYLSSRNACTLSSNKKHLDVHKSILSIRSYSKSSVILNEDRIAGGANEEPDMIFSEGMTAEEAQRIVDEQLALLKAEEEAKQFKDWVPGTRKRPLRVSYNEDDFDESKGPKWTLRHKRSGALGIKLGMMPVWDEWGQRHACTVLFLDENIVMEVKNKEKHGYDSIVVGAGERKLKRVKKPLLGYYNKLGLKIPPAITREFRIGGPGDVAPEPGTSIHARHFVPGQNVDISGISKGKGFQGAMKRHNFKGMPASHGVSKSHRALGSTGQCQDPGRVFKGKKMAGRMGAERVTVQNLRVLKIDRGRDLLYVKGAVPGNKGEFVEIKDAIKKPLWGTDLIEGGKEMTRPPLPTFQYEKDIDGSGEPGFDVYMPLPDKDPKIPMDIESI